MYDISVHMLCSAILDHTLLLSYSAFVVTIPLAPSRGNSEQYLVRYGYPHVLT
jgi:hypothetical protein